MDINLCSTPSGYFQPLHVDTSVEYTLGDEKFPGLNESQHRAEPALMVAPGYGHNFLSERKRVDALWEESAEAQMELFDLLEIVDLNEDYPCQSENLLDILPALSENASEIENGLPDLSHVEALGDIAIESAQSASEMGNGLPVSRVSALRDNIPVLSESHLEMGDAREVSHTIYEMVYNRSEISRRGPEMIPEISHSASEVGHTTPDLSKSAVGMGYKYHVEYMDTSCLSNDASFSKDNNYCIESSAFSLFPSRFGDMDGDINLSSVRDRCMWNCMRSQKYGSTETCCRKRALLPESETELAICWKMGKIESSAFSLFPSRFSDMDGDINLPSVNDILPNRCRWHSLCSQKYGSTERCSRKRTVEPAICWKVGKCESKNRYCSQIQCTSNHSEYLHCDSKKTFATLQRSTKYHKKTFGVTYSPYTTPSIRQW